MPNDSRFSPGDRVWCVAEEPRIRFHPATVRGYANGYLYVEFDSPKPNRGDGGYCEDQFALLLSEPEIINGFEFVSGETNADRQYTFTFRGSDGASWILRQNMSYDWSGERIAVDGGEAVSDPVYGRQLFTIVNALPEEAFAIARQNVRAPVAVETSQTLVEVEAPAADVVEAVEQDALEDAAWTGEHSTEASAEGWDLFMVDGVGLQIQKDDEIGRFARDADAVAFVKERASQGSQLHLRAQVHHNPLRPAGGFATAMAATQFFRLRNTESGRFLGQNQSSTFMNEYEGGLFLDFEIDAIPNIDLFEAIPVDVDGLTVYMQRPENGQYWDAPGHGVQFDLHLAHRTMRTVPSSQVDIVLFNDVKEDIVASYFVRPAPVAAPEAQTISVNLAGMAPPILSREVLRNAVEEMRRYDIWFNPAARMPEPTSYITYDRFRHRDISFDAITGRIADTLLVGASPASPLDFSAIRPAGSSITTQLPDLPVLIEATSEVDEADYPPMTDHQFETPMECSAADVMQFVAFWDAIQDEMRVQNENDWAGGSEELMAFNSYFSEEGEEMTRRLAMRMFFSFVDPLWDAMPESYLNDASYELDFLKDIVSRLPWSAFTGRVVQNLVTVDQLARVRTQLVRRLSEHLAW